MPRFPEAVLGEQGLRSTLCLLSPPSYQELYKPNAESLRQQEELRRLYQRQQERGGIIDLEAERNRYFISLQQVRKPFPILP